MRRNGTLWAPRRYSSVDRWVSIGYIVAIMRDSNGRNDVAIKIDEASREKLRGLAVHDHRGLGAEVMWLIDEEIRRRGQEPAALESAPTQDH